METKLSRRQFLKTCAITAAAIGVTVCGGGALAASYRPEIELPSASYGDAMNKQRVLVTYASKAGSTAEIAIRIGEVLAKRGLAVDVRPVDNAGDLTGYDSVILGSAIRTGQLLPEAMGFVEKNQAALRAKAFSAFIVCLTLEKDTAETRKTVSTYLDPLRELVKPASEGMFAGVMNLSKLGWFERLMMAVMKSPVGDFRRWDQINAWAESAPVSLN